MKLASVWFLSAIVSVQVNAAPYKTTADYKATVAIASGSVAFPIPGGSVVEVAHFDSAKETQAAEFNAFKFEVPTSLLQAQAASLTESRTESAKKESAVIPPIPEVKPDEKAVSKPPVSSAPVSVQPPIFWKVSDPGAPQLLQFANYSVWAPEPTGEPYMGILILFPAAVVKMPLWQKFAREHHFILFGIEPIGEVPTKLSSKLGKTIKENLGIALEKLQKAQGDTKITYKEHYLIYGNNLGAEIAGLLPAQDFPPPDQIIAVGFAVGGYGLSLPATPYATKIPYLVCMGKFEKPEIVDATLKSYRAGLPSF